MLKHTVYSMLFAALLAGLTGCGAGEGQLSTGYNNNDSTSQSSAGASTGSSLALTWDVPTMYVDGSSFVPAGYKIYYGTSSGNYTQAIDVGNITTLSLGDLNLAPGKYYFTVTTYDAIGMESGMSNEVSRTVA